MRRIRPTAREIVIQKLEAFGYEVVSIEGVTGHWRKEDCYRWEAWCKQKGQRFHTNIQIGSYATMTECARWHMTLAPIERRGGTSLEAHAEKRPKA